MNNLLHFLCPEQSPEEPRCPSEGPGRDRSDHTSHSAPTHMFLCAGPAKWQKAHNEMEKVIKKDNNEHVCDSIQETGAKFYIIDFPY